MNDRLVIIPTYNEKENIENIIRCVFSLKPAFDILIIEDNSPDGTAGIVKTLQKEFTNLHIIERKGKLGLGTAYITGFKWALEHRYDYIFEMDADFSHNPRDLVRLYEACVQGADLSIGSRYVTGVNVVNWPMSRVLLSFFASKYVTYMPDKEQLIAQVEAVLSSNNNTDIDFSYINNLIERGETDKAISRLKTALSSSPEESRIYNMLGEAYQSAGNSILAEKFFKAAEAFK